MFSGAFDGFPAGEVASPRNPSLGTAPSAPQLPEVIVDSGCGGAQASAAVIAELGKQILPVSVGGLSASVGPPPAFAELLSFLGASEGTPLDVFTCLPEEDLLNAVHDVTVDDAPISAIQRAGLIKHIRFIFSSCGCPAPALGAVVSETSSSVPPAVPARSSSTQLALQSIPADTVYLNQIVDQNLRAQTRMLSFSELGGYRAYYENVCGSSPPEGQEPSGEQLAGLKALLDSGRVPYVDFSVWNPLGPRMAKFRRTESSVLIGGEFVTRHIEGPSSYANWEDSWSLFSVGMISLGAATPGSLAAYAAGIKTCDCFPAGGALSIRRT